MTASSCRYCGQQIRWVRTESGANMPLDPDPTPQGNVALIDTPYGPRARVLKAQQLLDWKGRLWMPHQVTCTAVHTASGMKRST